MSVLLLAENILDADNFLSATEQAGAHMGPAEPDSLNMGKMRVLTSGELSDFVYSGTTTGNGAGDGTTVIDSVLTAYGDDFFIDATIEITSGACNGESKTASDFDGTTGTLTTPAFSAQIVSGVTFTVTIPYQTRDFQLKMWVGGDIGETNTRFKWSHDGATFLAEEENVYSTFRAEKEIDSDIDDVPDVFRCCLVECSNGDLLAFYNESSATASTPKMRRSTDRGITWGAESVPYSSAYFVLDAIRLSGTSKILLFVKNVADQLYILHSRDDGVTWDDNYYPLYQQVNDPPYLVRVIELVNGNLLMVFEDSSHNIKCQISTSEGLTWGSEITIASDTNDQRYPAACINQAGDILVAYATDEDSSGDFEIKLKKSTDGGTTWSSAIDVIDFSTVDIIRPHLVKWIKGDWIFCYAEQHTAAGGYDIISNYSADDGDSWGTSVTAYSTSNNIGCPFAILYDGHEVIIGYQDLTDLDFDMVRGGMWGTGLGYLNEGEYTFVCGAKAKFAGGNGWTGDNWDLPVRHHFGMANLIEDNPQKTWRSDQDNIDCRIVLDAGANERFYADAVAFFGSNVRTLKFQMNDTNVWTSPSVDETISFDLTTSGEVDAVAGNAIKDTALLANYKDHELKGRYLRMTSGVDSGLTWKILDNVGDYIIIDTTAATNIAATDTFAIYQTKIAKTFTAGVHRYMSILIEAQQTAEDYYELGAMLSGRVVTLSRGWAVGFAKNYQFDVEILRPEGGGMTAIKRSDEKVVFDLTWHAAEDSREEALALLKYVEGKNICLVPDSSDLTDVYQVKHIENFEQEHIFLDRFDFTITLEEV